jgi:D-alanine-D-alanine ligase
MGYRKVAVLMGGTSSEREVSLSSGRAVARALRGRGHFVWEVDLLREALDEFPPEAEAAFLAMHGVFGEDGRLQRMLADRGIPYTGSGPEASRKAMDKWVARGCFRAAGVSVSDAFLADGLDVKEVERRIGRVCGGYPVVVKPTLGGSSIGVSRVEGSPDLQAALAFARAHGPCMVERWVEGREMTLGILEGVVLPLIELKPARKFYDYQAKYAPGSGTVYQVAPELSKEAEREFRRQSEAAFGGLGCFGFGRADGIIDRSGQGVILEINTLPGMTPTSLLPKAAAAAGIDFPELCERMLDTAFRMREE